MQKEKNVNDDVQVEDIPQVESTSPAPEQINIQIQDILDALRIIEVAIERSAFKAPELVTVIPVYQKLKEFGTQVQDAQNKQGE